MILSRLLEGVTLRRVLAALLVAAFAPEILSLFTWLVGVGWGLKDVPTLQAFTFASVHFVFEGALIYLALKGLGALLDRRRRERQAAAVDRAPVGAYGGCDREESQEGLDAACWPRGGGGNGRGPYDD